METRANDGETDAKTLCRNRRVFVPASRKVLVFLLGLAAVLGFSSIALAEPQTFNTALPVAKGEFVFREQFVATRATDDSSLADREFNVLGSVSVLGYGVTGNLAVFGLLPYLDKDLKVTSICELSGPINT